MLSSFNTVALSECTFVGVDFIIECTTRKLSCFLQQLVLSPLAICDPWVSGFYLEVTNYPMFWGTIMGGRSRLLLVLVDDAFRPPVPPDTQANGELSPMQVNKGGPNILEEPCNEERSLFLCYPDDFEGETESLGLRCLHSYEGDVVRRFRLTGV